MIDTTGAQQVFAVRVSSGRRDKGTVLLPDGGSRQPNGSCATADQQTFTSFEAQRLEQRTPRRLQHFGDGSERFPRKFSLDNLRLLRRHAGVFGVATVKLPTQSAHRRRDDIALAKLAP